MSEVAVVATIVARPGMEEKLMEQLGLIVGPSRVEAGALQYDLHRDREDPCRFVCIERWASDAALAAHASSAHLRAFQEAAGEWIERSEVRVMQRIA